MIKVPIKYIDFDDNEVTEDHYFHLSKSELIDMEMGASSAGEPMTEKLTRIGKSGNGALIMQTFREIIAAAYGQRVDGKGGEFYKNKDLTDRFMGSLAFDQLLTDLLTNATSAAVFVNGLMPKGLVELGAAVQGRQATTTVPLPDVDSVGAEHTGLGHPADENGNLVPWAFREPTRSELSSMTSIQMQDVYQRKTSGWKQPA